MIATTTELTKVLGISPSNLQDLFSKYKEAQENNPDAPAGLIANTQTALRRYVTPALGGPNLEGLNRTEVAVATHIFWQTVTLARFASVMDDLERYFNEASVPKKPQDSTFSYVRKLLDWSKSMGFTVTLSESVNESSEFKPYRFHDPSRDRSVRSYQISLTGKPSKARYRLGTFEEDYLNETLSKQIASFEEHLEKQGLSHTTRQNTLRRLKNVFGWLVRYKGYSLAELTFESVIQFSRLYPLRKPSQSRPEWLEAIDDAKDIAEDVARKNIKLIEEFLAFYSDNSNSRGMVLTSLTHVGEFLYKNETRDDEALLDIPIIKLLKSQRKMGTQKSKQQPKMVPIENKTLDDWASVVKVLQMLQYEADMTHYNHIRPDCRTGYRKKKRSPTAIAKSYRRFLAVAFLVLLPPDRRQMLQSLEPSVTLLRGDVKGWFPHERFIPAEKMQESAQALWYIKLTDYKTAGKHGIFHMPVPDFWLGNKSFYQYIDEWLNVYRPLYEPKHNCFFSADNGVVVDPNSYTMQFKGIFTRLAGKPVGPHMLRYIYRTDVNRFEAEKDGFKEMVRETTAKMMRHTKKIADAEYDHPDLQAKFMTIHAYNWVKYFEPIFGVDPRYDKGFK